MPDWRKRLRDYALPAALLLFLALVLRRGLEADEGDLPLSLTWREADEEDLR